MNAPHNPEMQALLNMTSETIGKDILSALVSEIKLMPDVWQKLAQHKQEDIIERLRKRVEANVRMACHTIASEGRSVVMGDLESVAIKDGIKATFKVSGGNPSRHDLFDSVGKPCLLVVADAGQHMQGMGEIKGESDQRSMDLGHEYHQNDGGGMEGKSEDSTKGLPSPDDVKPSDEELQHYYETGYKAAEEGFTKDDCPVVRSELVAEWVRGFNQWHEDHPQSEAA